MQIDGEGTEGADKQLTFADFEAAADAGEEPGVPPEDAEEGDDEEADPNVNDEAEEDAGEDPKPKKTAEDRIRELNAKYRQEQRDRAADRAGFQARLDAIEAGKKPLTADDDSGNEGDERVAPDPKDLAKYPLGALDDAFIQDTIDFKAEAAAVRMVDSLLQRQEQSEEQKRAEALLTDLRSKADDVATAGEKLHDDYQEVVLEAGLRGDYDLTQITFEAAAEAEHGAQILYDLASDPAEATRVASLSPLKQLQFVSEREAELAKANPPKKPGAKPPPDKTPKGGSRRQTISAATTNFAEFEKLADGKQ